MLFRSAKKFDIPVIQVIAKDGKEIENMTEAYTEASGTMINSGDWNGMESSVLKKEAPAMIEKMGFGRKTVNYKLRDWVFSRQRYWGEPIPIVHFLITVFFCYHETFIIGLHGFLSKFIDIHKHPPPE